MQTANIFFEGVTAFHLFFTNVVDLLNAGYCFLFHPTFSTLGSRFIPFYHSGKFNINILVASFLFVTSSPQTVRETVWGKTKILLNGGTLMQHTA